MKMNLSDATQLVNADDTLQSKLAQLSALSHVMADETFEDWAPAVTGPLRDLFTALGADIARITGATVLAVTRC